MRHHGRAALVLAALTLAMLLGLAHFRSPLSRVWGDEGTFLAMMASLTAEVDLRFEDGDLARVEAANGGGRHLILQRADDRIAYSKPVLYALAAAPFYAVLGERGPMLLNALALALALALGYSSLRRLGSGATAALVLVTFTGAGVVVPYVAWRMTDSFQGSLALIALALCLGAERGQNPVTPGPFDRLLLWRGAPLLGAALLGALANMRLSNAVLIVAPVAAALFARRRRRAALSAILAAAAYLAIAGLTLALTGAANPYRAARTSFTPTTGYPAGENAALALPRFEQVQAADRTGLLPHFGVRQVAYSVGYFVLGRHSGLAFYFPAALIFLLFALRHGDRVGRSALLAFFGALVFFVGWRAENYFGGDTFLGNRYFLSIYPLLLFALPRLPSGRWLAAAWALAAVAYGSALASVARHHDLDIGSQSHARAGIFRFLPYESTARNIEGRRDRYWAGHFVRFVDPFSDVGPWHFELHAGRPAAELLVAHWRPLSKIRLWVDTPAREATLEIRDYGSRSTFVVGTEQVAERGELGVPVNLETSRPWRRHRYWWDPETLYHTRAVRLRLLAPGGQPAAAKLRYFGDPELLEQAFSYHLLGDDIPTRATAGTTSRVTIKVRSTAPLIWEREDVVPVQARYRLTDATGQPVFETDHIPLPHRVEPYHDADLAADVSWPEEPGTYLLEADLVLEHVAWFADRLGEPVARRQVEVEAEDLADESTNQSESGQ